MTDVSVVIVNWNSGERLAACLASLPRAGERVEWEAIVVDNHSSDGSVERAVARAPWATFVTNGANRGLAAANNQGTLLAGGETIVFANPDTEFAPASLDALHACLARRPLAAFVAPRVRFPDGEVQTTAGDLPSLWEALAGRQRQWRRSKYGAPRGFCWDGWAHDEERRIGRAGDVAYAARRDAIARIGLQDERFVLDWEAVDWSARARDEGFEVWFTPDAELIHHAGTSTGRAHPVRWVVQTHLGMYRYFRKRRAPGWAPALAVAFGLRAVVKAVLVVAGVPLHERAQRPA